MKKFSIEIKWAINFSLMTLVWMIIEHSFGLHDKLIDNYAIYSNLYAIPAISIYFFAIRDKKINFYFRNMTFSQGFISGVILSVFIALLSPIIQYVSFRFISPNFFENMINYAVSHKIQTQMQAQNYFSINNYIFQGIYDSLSMGIVTTAFISFFLKTKPKNN